ncbi:MAG TPA: phosphoribosylamine--glycine ligase [Candidatus Aquilonibacter sp.]|nr:phosphoribosylamine--glycine ligase [Candidatus Aquilonibacter sp.]
MQERILILGSGAREHAIAVALARSPQHPELLCFGSTRNPGIAALTRAYTVGDICDHRAVTAFAREHNATLAIIGPEAPLAAGVTDALWSASIPTVGPTQSLARIESSKSFTRSLLDRHHIPGNPIFQRFTSLNGVEALLDRLGDAHVIKDDGLAGGKGVKVFGDHLTSRAESLAFCNELLAAGHPFVIEEKLEGEEFSLLSFTDGVTLRHMPAVQDHKRAFNGDRGPNTGGMGSYTDVNGSLPFLTAVDIASAHRTNEHVIAALHRDLNEPYRGILYGGFMATRNGIRLIEYNARFGDPECLNLLTLLETDLVAICRAIVSSTLYTLDVDFTPAATVCKYLVPEGYPDRPRKGDLVPVPAILPPETTVYLGSVDTDAAHDDRLVSAGSRTLAVVSCAPTLPQAESVCESVLHDIRSPFFHRSDIGTSALIGRRVEHMNSLRANPAPTTPRRNA